MGRCAMQRSKMVRSMPLHPTLGLPGCSLREAICPLAEIGRPAPGRDAPSSRCFQLKQLPCCRPPGLVWQAADAAIWECGGSQAAGRGAAAAARQKASPGRERHLRHHARELVTWQRPPHHPPKRPQAGLTSLSNLLICTCFSCSGAGICLPVAVPQSIVYAWCV